jgi:hypothetical protein
MKPTEIASLIVCCIGLLSFGYALIDRFILQAVNRVRMEEGIKALTAAGANLTGGLDKLEGAFNDLKSRFDHDSGVREAQHGETMRRLEKVELGWENGHAQIAALAREKHSRERPAA